MLLNRAEFALMNNPVRAAVQRYYEAELMLRLGGPLQGGRVLEVGCGRGVGTGLILEKFGATAVDAFDLDFRMVRRARKRLAQHGPRVHLWVGDAAAISVPDGAYDAVVDFGIIHHIPDWRRAVNAIFRVLKPGGRLYAEEVLAPFIMNPVIRRIFEHPLTDRFDAAGFAKELRRTGFENIRCKELWGSFAWFSARKPDKP